MNNIFLYIFLLIIIGVIFYLKYINEKIDEELPYKKKGWLMTKAEREFFKVLEQAVGGRYYIVPQVKISGLVFVPRGKHYQKYLNKIDRKTVDFVLVDKQFSPVMVIELDDSSHNNDLRKERDKFVDKVMEKIGLKIIHIKTAYSYTIEELNNTIFNTK